jgi:hypothetical protein
MKIYISRAFYTALGVFSVAAPQLGVRGAARLAYLVMKWAILDPDLLHAAVEEACAWHGDVPPAFETYIETL